MVITGETGIKECVQKYPKTAAVFMEFGMGCLGCAAAHFENIEQGAVVHGIDVPALLEALNKAVEFSFQYYANFLLTYEDFSD